MTKSIFYSKIFIIMCIFAVIYLSGYALSTVYDIRIYILLLFAYIFIFPIVLVHFKRNINILILSFFLLVSMIIINFITSGLNAPITYISYIATIIIAFGIVTVYDFEDFLAIFLKIMVFVSIVSLIGHYAVNSNQISLHLPILENTNSIPYGVGYIFFYIPLIPERNAGVFWEPGLFATFLIIALLFEIIYKNSRISLVRIILFLITIITTRSSAGYGLIIFIFALILIKKSSTLSNNKMRSFVTFVVFIICLIILINYPLIFNAIGMDNNEVVNKLMGDQLEEQSRILAIKHNLSMLLNSFIFGLGVTETARNVKYVADTSTSTYILSIFGIFGLQYTFYWIYGILKDKRNDIYVNILIAVIFLFIINKEPHFNNVFSWCVMFYYLKASVSFKLKEQ